MKHQLKNVTFSLIFICLFGLSYGQSFEPKDFENMKFRNIGPSGMSGRITAIDVDLSNTNRIFVGAASGGVWKSENGGTTWDPIFDEMPTLSIGAIKINQNNPAEIWVGTGEGNPRNSHNSGAGVFKTIDGGKSWKYMGLKETKLIHRIAINDQNPNEVYIGAMGSAWGNSQHRGVYKTKDGGVTWDKILYVNDQTGIAEMVMDPQNPNKIFAAMWEFGRKPWTFNSGGVGSGLYLTYDGGKNWKRLNDDEEANLPKGKLGRIGLAIAPSKPNIVYALIESKKTGLYKSTDGGEKWNLVSTENIGNRPFYYAEIYVDPSNENRIFNLWSYVSKSEDGGKTFKTIMDYGNNIHPDHHAWWMDPNDPNYMIDGNDGGLNITRDGGENWQFIENLPVGQFYHVSVDDDFPYHVYGGMQDNGSWIGPGFKLARGGITNGDWQELYFGDGFDVQARKDDSRYGFAMSQGGNVAMYDRETGSTTFIKPAQEEEDELRYNWNAAIALDPFDDKGIYFCSQYVHYSNDLGKSWSRISDDLTTNDSSKQKQYLSGGLTIDDTQAENNTTILCIAPSPLDKDIIWVGTDDGMVQKTSNGGDNWTTVNKGMRNLPKSSFIPQIHPSKHDSKEAFVVVNNYRMNDWRPFLYHTKDGGRTFTNLVDGKNIDGFVCSIVQDPIEENLLFLGTDVGLYISFDKGKKWTKWDEGMPPVQIRDMVIQETFSDLVIGTFGRSFWVFDDLECLREMCKENNDMLKKELHAFDPPIAYMTDKRSYDGVRFIGQANFVGDNAFKGAYFPIWRKPVKKDKKLNENTEEKVDLEKKSKDDDKEKIKVFILDTNGDTIRKYKREIKNGYNRIGWGMSRKGVRYPSHESPKEDEEPGGMQVLPGRYKAIFKLGETTDSTEIEIRFDPRSKLKKEDLIANYESRLSYQEKVENATLGFNQLKSAEKSIAIVSNMLEMENDSLKKDFEETHATLKSQIDSLKLEYMLPKKTKGYQDSSKKLNTYLWQARNYIGRSWGAPGQNADQSVNKAINKMNEVSQGITAFLESDWKEYQTKVKATDFKLFEKQELLQILEKN